MSKRYIGDPNAMDWQVAVDNGPGTVKRALPLRLDVRNHSPDGFAWGYGGSGPAQLALAMLCDALGDVERASAIYQRFKDRHVATLPGDEPFVMPAAQVVARAEAIERGAG